MKKILAIVLLFNCYGCAMVAQYIGASAATIQTAQTIDSFKLAADVGSAAGTGKTLVDHAISYVMDMDCLTMRWLEGEYACVEE